MSSADRQIVPIPEETSGAQSMFAQQQQQAAPRVLKKLSYYGHGLVRRLASRMPRSAVPPHRIERFSRAAAAGLLFRAGKKLPSVHGLEGGADIHRHGVIGHNLRTIIEAARRPYKHGLGIADLRRLHKHSGVAVFLPAAPDAAARRAIESGLSLLDSKQCYEHLMSREQAVLGADPRKSSLVFKYVRAKVAHMFPFLRVSAHAVCILAESVLAQLDHLRHLIVAGGTLFSAEKHIIKIAKDMHLSKPALAVAVPDKPKAKAADAAPKKKAKGAAAPKKK